MVVHLVDLQCTESSFLERIICASEKSYLVDLQRTESSFLVRIICATKIKFYLELTIGLGANNTYNSYQFVLETCFLLRVCLLLI